MVKKLGIQNPIVQFILDNVGCSFELSLNQGTVIHIPVEVDINADEECLYIIYHEDKHECLIRLSSIISIKTLEE